MDPSSRIPVVILTGFLGSGKTSALNYLLQARQSPRIAVLVNDFGSINIDARLIVNVSGAIISLANGCICCSIRGDLYETIKRLLAESKALDAILIEASGISEPAEIAQTFISTDLADRIRLDCILGVIDASQVLQLDKKWKALAQEQIAVADIILLNKADLAAAEMLADVRAWIQKIAPEARILETLFGRFPIDLLFVDNHAGFDHSRLAGSSDEHDHHDHAMHHNFETMTLQAEEALSLIAVQRMLNDLPNSIYRAKGFLHIHEFPNQPVIVQMAGKRISLTPSGAWEHETPRSQLVLIGSKGDFDRQKIVQAWEICLFRQRGDLPVKTWLEAAIHWWRK